MFIKAKVHPSSKREEVVQKSPDTFEIFVRAKPIDGEATGAVIVLLSEFLNVPRSSVRIVRGWRYPQQSFRSQKTITQRKTPITPALVHAHIKSSERHLILWMGNELIGFFVGNLNYLNSPDVDY